MNDKNRGKVLRYISRIEPWAVLAFLLALTAFVIDLEDRRSERLFRAWGFILENDQIARKYDYYWEYYEKDSTAPAQALVPEDENNSGESDENSNAQKDDLAFTGGAVFQALEYLNRDVDGKLCSEWVLQPIFHWLTGTVNRKCIFPSRRRESLANRYLPRAQLQGIKLSKANLEDTNLEGADLSWAELKEASLRGASLAFANLYGADLTDASLRDANLEYVDLYEANLRRANFRKANLQDADLDGADLTGAKFREANLTDADLSEANLTKAKFDNTNVSGAEMGEVLGLTEEQLGGACVRSGSEPPVLSEELERLNIDWSERPCR